MPPPLRILLPPLFVLGFLPIVLSISVETGEYVLKRKGDRMMRTLMPNYEDQLRRISAEKREYKYLDLDSSDLETFREKKNKDLFSKLNSEAFQQNKFSKEMSAFLLNLIKAALTKPSTADIENTVKQYRSLAASERSLLGRSAPDEFRKLEEIYRRRSLRFHRRH